MIVCVKPALKILGPATVFVLYGCASVLDEDGALAIAPYHIEDSGRIVVEARVNSQGPFEFALDTASSISVIFDKLRTELNLEPVPGKWVIIHGAVASGRFPLLSIDRLEIGREVWADARMTSLPAATIAATTIDGILGIDFMRRYAVGFSAKDRVVRLYPPDLIADRSYRGWAAVPLEPEQLERSSAALYFLEIEIDGHKVPALFDLGAGLNALNWSAARTLPLARADSRRKGIFSGALETTRVVAQLNAREVTTASIRWRNEVFSVAELTIFATLQREDTPTAILGAGLFSQRDFIIDFVRSRLLVKVAMDELDRSTAEDAS